MQLEGLCCFSSRGRQQDCRCLPSISIPRPTCCPTFIHLYQSSNSLSMSLQWAVAPGLSSPGLPAPRTQPLQTAPPRGWSKTSIQWGVKHLVLSLVHKLKIHNCQDENQNAFYNFGKADIMRIKVVKIVSRHILSGFASKAAFEPKISSLGCFFYPSNTPKC